jgi:hypothetical protein
MIPLPHIVSIQKAGEKDRWGLVTYSDPVHYPAFVQYSSDKIITKEGNEIKVDLNITFNEEVNLTYSDKVLFKGIEKNPSSIEKIFDLSGKVLYTKVLV